MKCYKLLLIVLLIVGCAENSTESGVHPLVGVWLAIEGTKTSIDGTVLDTIIFDETNSANWIFSDDGMLSWILVSSENGSQSSTAIWSATDNKLTIISQHPDNTGETTIWDYSISGTILSTVSIDSELNNIEIKYQKQ